MPPVPSSSATNTVSPSQHLRLAPSSNRESFARHEIRQLVLEYLISSCYVDSAQAFAREVDLLDKGADRDDTATAGHASGTEAANERGAARIAVANGVKDNDEHAMEGVEATPPPHEPRDDDSAFMDGGDHDAGNGVRSKSTRKVAFEEEEVAEELRDTSMLSTERLREGRLRREIQSALLAGRVQHAIDLLTKHFPAVLGDYGPAASTSATTTPRPAASKPSLKKCTPQSYFSPTPSTSAASNSAPSATAAIPVLGSDFGPWSLSLSPHILWLNLRLQAFVEVMRTAHTHPSPSNAGSRSATPTRLSDSIHSMDSANGGLATSTSSLSSMSASVMSFAISYSQALNAEVRKLPPGPEREHWERECIDVAGLLAYKDLTTCPVRGYLAQERRQVLAELVNAAILQRTGHTPLPLLSLAATQCTAMWDTLAEWKLPFPPPTSGSAPARTSSSAKAASKTPQTYPLFRLSTFLAEQEPVEVEGPLGAAANGSSSRMPPR